MALYKRERDTMCIMHLSVKYYSTHTHHNNFVSAKFMQRIEKLYNCFQLLGNYYLTIY